MNATATVTLLGGLGLFLLGIHHLTEGLKGLAGDSLRRALQRLVSGRFSAVRSGAFFTAVIQSSTAAILTVIGFVSAGLVTFSQAIGMIIGCDARNDLDAMVGGGVRSSLQDFCLCLAHARHRRLSLVNRRGKTRSFGAILAGFGLIFTGIDYLQTGMGGFRGTSRRSPARVSALGGFSQGSGSSCRSSCRARPRPGRRHWSH